MVYFLGRDVKVWICTEDTGSSIQQNGTAMSLTVEEGANSRVKKDDGSTNATFALALHSDSVASGDALSDITGVDFGLGATDEDVSYMGQRSVLKAEIKKETTITLTKKKSGPLWDLVWNGGAGRKARWGIDSSAGSGANEISEGGKQPKDFKEGSDVSFGYRIFVQLKSGTEVISIPACQVTSYSVTLNADGITEESMEFMSHADPIVAASHNVTTRMSATTI